ncbi:MAG: hypothetical protein ACTSV2_18485 [Candidatus Thorarchaeota archaeon]
MSEQLKKKQTIWLIFFALLTFLLPVGLRYTDYPVNDAEHLVYRIEFIPPMKIEVSQIGVTPILLVSSLGILMPFFIAIHTWLILRMTKIVKGESSFSSIRFPLLLVSLISLACFFPTFRADWGNIPFPLMLPIGALFAKFADKPLPSTPFES